ncbi:MULTISPECIES: hypothetical protein [Coprobacillaceae]|uniref:hypothetical protein n=1 Tax=Coprobacillaceae TaxID=2810280 RepID=UPI000E4FF41F|nr:MULTISPECIES: hypothetical protein [Coprobacillaceae]RHM59851.1 hypothetical protein DWZ53_08420 [Coprobacillus sp. AF33-1AC]RHS92182.1 hypothetical protein DW911_09095 [Erysipelatoclostridium sp. AM42-17]
MEGIVQLDKTKDLERCKGIVKDILLEEVSDELLTIITNEVMDTCMFIGGDFADDNIKDIARQYVVKGGIERVKKAYGVNE